MARSDNQDPDRQQPTSARIREAIATVLDATTVFTHLAGFHEAALIAHLGAYGLHLVNDGPPRTPATTMLAVLDTASMLTHLLGLHEVSLILHLSGCTLRLLLLLHPRVEAAVRATAAWIAPNATRAAQYASRALARVWYRMRNHLRRNR
ncbi:hypothetical protein ACFYT3_31190 [Nocardia amikacinitolerans]|uniref:hypothetical protein n=1 Tax=Nocardia amikacinitolerans TaxID=756689 RepID=UPI00368E5991